MSEENEAPLKKSGADSTFNAKTLTITKEHGGKKDNEAPEWGKLSPAAIAQPSAVAQSLPGADVKVIHGDYNEYLLNEKNTNVLGNEILNVQKDQTETIHLKSELTYVHGRGVMVGDLDELQVNGIQKKYVLGESEETYIRTHEVHAPDEFEVKHFEQGLTFVEFKLLGIGASVKGRESEVKISGDKEALYESFMTGFREEAKGHHGEVEAHSDKAATSLEVNLRGNAAPDVGLGTPVR
jgi:hypothetical protein